MADKNRLRELGLLPLWHPRSNTDIDSSKSDQSKNPENSTGDTIEQKHIVRNMDWAQLNQSVTGCLACPLGQTRKKTVFGVGDQAASWLFVGEGPGAREDETGEPFVGQAGKLLDSLLQSIDIDRYHDVYITNIVKCRPPDNRNPQATEAEKCRPYLLRQIELIQPKLIIALGKVAAGNLLATHDSLASLRGKVHDFMGTPLIVTYHPAYLLRSLTDKAKAWEDLCFARAFMQSVR
ncbi:MAG: uracil-DNA glycosylase [Nitrosomonas sp.]|nr:uracil-DNA glycosylase [Nitrosomonas sp.]